VLGVGQQWRQRRCQPFGPGTKDGVLVHAAASSGASPCMTWAIRSSSVTPSARDAKERAIRWRSTGGAMRVTSAADGASRPSSRARALTPSAGRHNDGP